MTRTFRLVRATRLQLDDHAYQQGLQSMWEARWTLRGARGEIHWLICHGALPGEACPLLEGTAPSEAPQPSAARPELRGVRGLTPRIHPLGLHRRKA